MAAPVFSRIFMDEILSGKNAAWLTPFLAALGALFLFQTAVSLLQTVCLLKIRGKLAVSANSGFMWHVLRLPIEFFSQRYAGDIAQRQQSNEGIAETLIAHLAPMALNLAMLFFYFFVMLQYSPLLTVIGLFTAVLNLAVTQYVSGKRINLARAQMRDAGKLAATALSGIEMIETIKASGAENGFFERWSGLNASVNSAEVGFAKLGSTLGILPTLFKYLGYSMNTRDPVALEAAKQKLIEQKQSGVVKAYQVDETKDKMVAGEAALAVMWSGDAQYAIDLNPDLAYAIPKEGSNVWVDCMVIPKTAKNKENAEAFINFLCRPDIAQKNCEAIWYSTPNTEAHQAHGRGIHLQHHHEPLCRGCGQLRVFP